MSNRFGHRGYIASRKVRGQFWPQHVQNLVIRDYAQRNRLDYLLSATEYAMPGCYMNLEAVLEELEQIRGIILFSLFMLPEKSGRRRRIYDRVLESGADLHGALENMALGTQADVQRVEDIFQVERYAAPAGLTLAVAG